MQNLIYDDLCRKHLNTENISNVEEAPAASTPEENLVDPTMNCPRRKGNHNAVNCDTKSYGKRLTLQQVTFSMFWFFFLEFNDISSSSVTEVPVSNADDITEEANENDIGQDRMDSTIDFDTDVDEDVMSNAVDEGE